VKGGFAQCVLEFVATVDRRRPTAVRFGQRLEVGLRQERMAVDVVVEQFLPLAHHAQTLVVDGTLTGSFEATSVESSAALIWKPPSPTTAHTGRPGSAVLTPNAAGSA
jgi:hypothetical protein